ncbi:S-layer homology domain-containing protein [Paenibacillus sp. SYP-B3998]|uniref:S-layer homology domain-containing protein n=1 Tax=Paenibacillus sp. SYP-B3998 TaxID=2678564 RepID=A0A6G4A4A2_9BACL|nr:S-layer homology domain-containing protein [Paenibacillus sp. SYP-B3998]NEW09336.1 S-layer homology domain-containing protein [Paenibacillus sp. SYP-B3998]
MTLVHEPTHAFSDLASNHWAAEQILRWNELGILQGYEDITLRKALAAGYFQLDAENKSLAADPLSRAEATIALEAVYHFHKDRFGSVSNFIDPDNVCKEATAAIQALVAKGYIEGFEYHTYRPEKTANADLGKLINVDCDRCTLYL